MLSWAGFPVFRTEAFLISTERETSAAGPTAPAPGLETPVLMRHAKAAANSSRPAAMMGKRGFIEGGWSSAEALDAL